MLIPEENVKDLQDIPENAKSNLEIVPVRWIDRVLEVALESIPVPLPYPSCPAFGGPDLDILYLTSIANSGHRIIANHPDAGRITAIRGLDAPGIAEGIYR